MLCVGWIGFLDAQGYASGLTLWCWTQTVGQTLCAQTQKDLATLADGTAIPEEELSDKLANRTADATHHANS